IERSTLVAGPDLKLGLQVFAADGRLLLAEGSLAQSALGPPDELPKEAGARVVRDVDLTREKYPYLVVTRRMSDGRAVQGAIYMRRFVRAARSVRDIYLWTLPLAGVFTLLLGSWLVRGSLRPIAAIARAAQRISGTHLEERVPATGSGD